MSKEDKVKIAEDLVKKTAQETATALNIQYIQRDILDIKQAIKDLLTRDDKYALKEDFVFWRNLLVSGLLVSIAIIVISDFFQK